jgi:hypothetical protein
MGCVQGMARPRCWRRRDRSPRAERFAISDRIEAFTRGFMASRSKNANAAKLRQG